MGFFFWDKITRVLFLIKKTMTNFKQLKIWIKGMEMTGKSFQFIKTLSTGERYMIGTQLIKSAVSVPSNIAEGCSRRSRKEYYRFLEIALGSTYEFETQIMLTQIANLGDANLRKQLLEDVVEEQKMLNGFIAKLSQELRM